MARRMMDIATNVDGDVKIVGGDFVNAESTEQHQRLLVISDKGEWNQFITTGVGAFGFMDDDRKDSILRVVSQEFTKDGMTVNKIVPGAENGNFEIDASY